MPRLVKQPEGTGMCGHCCIAMASKTPLKRVIELIPDTQEGTTAKQVATVLRHLGVNCADRLKRVSKNKPVWPPRALLSIHRPKEDTVGRKEIGHWMLAWDGKILDPSGRWPEGYEKWKITSFLEIYQ